MSTIRPRHLHGLYVGHWAGNLGDSAVFDVLDRALPATVRFTLEVCSNGKWRARPQTSFIPWEDRAGVEEALTACEVAVIPGTTIVTDLHEGEWPIAIVATEVAAAQARGKKVHAIGVGVYPTENEAGSDRFIRLARSIEHFTVRDIASRDALLVAGVEPRRIELAADLAWLLDRPRPASQPEESLAVNVVHEDWHENESFYRTLATELDEIHRQTGWLTKFFCNEVRAGAKFDEAAARRVAASMHSPSELVPAVWMHPEEMIARLAACRHAVSMRYHFSIFAALAGVSWTGFARGKKNRSLLAEFGRPATLEMGQLQPGRLVSEVLTQWQPTDPTALQQRARLCIRHLQEVVS